jgi:uncharacterized membrane protein
MKVLLTLHLIGAVFLVGPVVGSCMVAMRATRTGDVEAARGAARTTTVYGWATLAVFVLGAAMVQGKDRSGHFSFTNTWIIASIVLYAAAFVLTVFVLAPALQDAATKPLRPQLAAVAGVITVLYLAIVVLMVYKP